MRGGGCETDCDCGGGDEMQSLHGVLRDQGDERMPAIDFHSVLRACEGEVCNATL